MYWGISTHPVPYMYGTDTVWVDLPRYMRVRHRASCPDNVLILGVFFLHFAIFYIHFLENFWDN